MHTDVAKSLVTAARGSGVESGADHRYRVLSVLAWVRIAGLVMLTLVSVSLFWKNGEALWCTGLKVLYCILALGLCVSIAELTALSLGVRARTLTVPHILCNLALAAGWLYATGGAGSLFSFLFLVVVIESSVLLDAKGTFAATTVAAFLYWVMAHLEFRSVLVPLQGSIHEGLLARDHYPASLLLFTLAAMYLTGGLSSYSREKIRKTREILVETTEGMEDLKAIHEHIVRCIHSGLVTVGMDNRITSFNQAAERITGLHERDVIGRHIEEVFGWSGQEGLASYEETTDVPFRWEVRFKHKEGREVPLGVSCSPLLDHKGMPLGFVYVFQDLTVYKKMEEELKRADRMAAIGELAAGLAHEIRNPLASLYGSVEILKSELSLKDTHRRLMEIVVSESERLNGLIGEFLKFANPMEVAKTRISLRSLVQETLVLFRNSCQWKENISVLVDIPPELALYANRGQMGQVLWNLLLNAAQALPRGGTISIVARQKRLRSQQAGSSKKAEAPVIEWSISDTGIGIPKEHLKKIFDPFFTTKTDGSGLGLAVVYRIIEKHGGKIHVESVPDKGTVFTLLLPQHDDKDHLADRMDGCATTNRVGCRSPGPVAA